jgi:hypothetical protein
MCERAAETLGALIEAEIPDIKQIVSVLPGDWVDTTAGEAFMTELGQLATDLQAYTPGETGSQEVLVIAQDVETGFEALSPIIPPQYEALGGLVYAELVIIVNTIAGNNAHAVGDTAAASVAHDNVVVAAAKVGYHFTPFTAAAIYLDPKHAASQYKKQSAKIREQSGIPDAEPAVKSKKK